MHNARQISMFIAITIWAVLIGGIAYSHVAFFPSYLSHLPQSTSLIKGEYGLKDENFWMMAHPVAILLTVLALVLNWKLLSRRRLIGLSLGIYVMAIVATALYFVPELMAFADSSNSTNVTSEEWRQRGQTWMQLSCFRGVFMFSGFILMLIALTKSNREVIVAP